MSDFKLLKYNVGALQTNCYFVSKGSDVLIFDAGESGDFILEKLQQLRLQPLAIFATHGHFDHVMAVGEIQLSFDIPFYISKKDLFLLDRAKKTAEFFLKSEQIFIKPNNIKNLKNEEMRFGEISFEALETPGHTPGSICFKFDDFILTGDTLFKGTVGRYDFSYSSKKQLKSSINRLFELHESIVVYPGHEDETTIGHEKKNPII